MSESVARRTAEGASTANPIAVAPIYDSEDLVCILEIEQRQVEDRVADLGEEQIE
jgi:hypothetical protein